MSSYHINTSSSDIKQSNGSAVTTTSTNFNDGSVRMGGNVSSSGPLNAIKVVETNDNSYGSVIVAGLSKSAGSVNWESSQISGSIANASSPWVGYAKVTDTSHGLSVNSVVRIVNDTSGVYNGVYRIVNVVDANSYVVNAKYSVPNSSGVTVEKGVALTSGGSQKPVGYLAANRYAIRGIALSLYNGSKTLSVLGSPGNTGTRRKIHSRTAVRSRLVATAIRNNYWNPYTGSFTTLPTLQNDFSTFGSDDEISDANDGIGLKGEFVYRYGAPTAATGDYDSLS